jgi:5''-nucleotidase/2'',3''-cyclic phosphodiesterase and related esterases
MLERLVVARPLLATLLLAACATQSARQSTPPPGTQAHLALLETTDIHTNVLSYDYFRLSEDRDIGFERAASLIRAARKEFENSLTFDDGDTIQGTSLADWQAQVKPLACDSELAVYKAMDELGYDAGTIGNHEFNYGLPFLSRAPERHSMSTACRPKSAKVHIFRSCSATSSAPRTANRCTRPGASSCARSTRTRRTAARATSPLRIGVFGVTPTRSWSSTSVTSKAR